MEQKEKKKSSRGGGGVGVYSTQGSQISSETRRQTTNETKQNRQRATVTRQIATHNLSASGAASILGSSSECTYSVGLGTLPHAWSVTCLLFPATAVVPMPYRLYRHRRHHRPLPINVENERKIYSLNDTK